MSELVIGIDLGTTNSVVATVHGGTPTVIPNRAGYRITPSVWRWPATASGWSARWPGGRR